MEQTKKKEEKKVIVIITERILLGQSMLIFSWSLYSFTNCTAFIQFGEFEPNTVFQNGGDRGVTLLQGYFTGKRMIIFI